MSGGGAGGRPAWVNRKEEKEELWIDVNSDFLFPLPFCHPFYSAPPPPQFLLPLLEEGSRKEEAVSDGILLFPSFLPTDRPTDAEGKTFEHPSLPLPSKISCVHGCTCPPQERKKDLFLGCFHREG